MANFQEGSSPSLSNFGTAIGGQANAYFLPEVYSANVQIAFRKSSVVEAITNTDYMGEVSNFGDTVNIIKEPDITVSPYTRGLELTSTLLTDAELVLVIDKANFFSFTVDDIEKKMSHVNWQSVASNRAAFKLKDAMDVEVLTAMAAGATVTIGADDLTAGTLADRDGGATESIFIGYTATSEDPLNVIARAARILDDANVPEDGRWFVAKPEFYEVLSKASSKLLSVDYNAGQGSIRNGLVTSGLLRGFEMYRSNNMPAGTNANIALAGHISSTATAQTILNTETARVEKGFGDLVKGLHVYGRKVLRPESIVKIFWRTATDA
jgi:hypothetical protein